jgi:hypothetical protein
MVIGLLGQLSAYATPATASKPAAAKAIHPLGIFPSIQRAWLQNGQCMMEFYGEITSAR